VNKHKWQTFTNASTQKEINEEWGTEHRRDDMLKQCMSNVSNRWLKKILEWIYVKRKYGKPLRLDNGI
jgi:hypothetical protein